MDNVTHTLVGLMLSRAGLGRLSPRATAILLLAANAPDIDVVTALGGSVNYLHYHRGLTHSLAAVPLVALLPVLLVRLVGRKPVAWKGACAASAVGVASHILIDWTNMYGVRLLLPFSGKWFNADLFAVVDVWVWTALLLGVAAPFVSRLVSVEIGARPGDGAGAAVFVLSFFAALGLGRYLLHERALAMLDSRIYENEAPLRVAAMPAPANPFRWVGLVEGSALYRVYTDLNVLRSFDPSSGRTFYKHESRPLVEKARQTEAFRVFLGFSQWPLWQVTPVADPENGSLVEAMDLRFGMPQEARFVARALVDGNQRVIESQFRFGMPGQYTMRVR